MPKLIVELSIQGVRLWAQHMIAASRISTRNLYSIFSATPPLVRPNGDGQFTPSLEVVSYISGANSSPTDGPIAGSHMRTRIQYDKRIVEKYTQRGDLPPLFLTEDHHVLFHRWNVVNSTDKTPEPKPPIILHIWNPALLIQQLQVISGDATGTVESPEYSSALITLAYSDQDELCLEVIGRNPPDAVTVSPELIQCHPVQMVYVNRSGIKIGAYDEIMAAKHAVFASFHANPFSFQFKPDADIGAASKMQFLTFLRRFIEIIPQSANSLPTITNTGSSGAGAGTGTGTGGSGNSQQAPAANLAHILDSPRVLLSVSASILKRSLAEPAAANVLGSSALVCYPTVGWKIVGSVLSSEAVMENVFSTFRPELVQQFDYQLKARRRPKVSKSTKRSTLTHHHHHHDDNDWGRDDGQHDYLGSQERDQISAFFDSDENDENDQNGENDQDYESRSPHENDSYSLYELPIDALRIMCHLQHSPGTIKFEFVDSIMRASSKFTPSCPSSEPSTLHQSAASFYSPIVSHARMNIKEERDDDDDE